MNAPLPLAGKRLLLSNDDGIAAPGLALLLKIARRLSRDVWVCAPEQEQSGAGHSLTLRRPLRLRRVGPKRFAVDGTPTDAVLLGIKEAVRGRHPDLLLSGVNNGGNLGEDVTYSGTVSAAMEGTLVGIPSIALSQERVHGRPVPWSTAERFAPDLIARLFAAGIPANVVINVNFPDCPPERVKGVRVVRQGKRKIGDQLGRRADLRGEPYFWIGPMRAERSHQPGTDLQAVWEDWIAVTPLHLDMTHEPSLAALGAALG
jgi:5'-nucleotidase